MSDGSRELSPTLAAVAAGDPRAFARWVAGAEPRIRLSLRSFAATVDTEAVLQETLLRCWQVAPRVEPDGRAEPLLRLGVRIARNLAVDMARRRRVVIVDAPALDLMVEAAVSAGPPPADPDPHLRRAIEGCRKRLPKRPRQALRSRLEAAGGASDHDLAKGLSMKLNTFLQNVTRARRLLAECLRRHGVDLGLELGRDMEAGR